MRNPNRIYPVVALLTELWAKNPDTRLTQLCQYVEAERAKRLGAESQTDLFYLDDDAFLEQLQILLDKEIKPVDPFFV
ncbi:MAG: hypothetical protein DRI24_21815 [Deltaproteobacteria bacterium]|nr:MAG: hypothetical protein DRI24_21815 [Deltaproteobacteria bacterium]